MSKKGGVHKSSRRLSHRSHRHSHHRSRAPPKNPTLKRHGYRIKSHTRGNNKHKRMTSRNIHYALQHQFPHLRRIQEEYKSPVRNTNVGMSEQRSSRAARRHAEVLREQAQLEQSQRSERRAASAAQRERINELANLFGKTSIHK